MGLFCLPKSDSKEDLLEYIRCSLSMYEGNGEGSSVYLLEHAMCGLMDLILVAEEIKKDEKEDLERAEFKKRNHCVNCEFWDTKDYPAPPKWIYYCNKSEDKDVFTEMKSKEDCELFEKKEEC